jgi:hypothetical protein
MPLLLCLMACQPSGFYDSHGNYHSSVTGFQGESATATNATDDRNAPAFDFGKPGFYDYKGGYVNRENAPSVPDNFLPPAGMCRILSADKPLSMQAPADACKARYHIPEGAFVIYGG